MKKVIIKATDDERELTICVHKIMAQWVEVDAASLTPRPALEVEITQAGKKVGAVVLTANGLITGTSVSICLADQSHVVTRKVK